jgi:3'(2'), 5'-bisphosphate nucleotidase
MSPETKDFVEKLKPAHPDLDYASSGSSLKLCLIAEGVADIYPRLAPTMEWDTAAGQAIVEYSGGAVLQADSGLPVVYNKEDLLNPWFIATRDIRNLP